MSEKDFVDKMREAYDLPLYSHEVEYENGVREKAINFIAYNPGSGLYLERINTVPVKVIAFGILLQSNDGEAKYKRQLSLFSPEQIISSVGLPAIIMKMDKIIEGEYKWIKTPGRAESKNLTYKKLTVEDFLGCIREKYRMRLTHLIDFKDESVYLATKKFFAFSQETKMFVEKCDEEQKVTIGYLIGSNRETIFQHSYHNITQIDYQGLVKLFKDIDEIIDLFEELRVVMPYNLKSFLDKIIEAYNLSKTNEKDGVEFFENPRLNLILEVGRQKEVRFGVCEENPSKNPQHVTKYIMCWSYYNISKTTSLAKVVEEIDSQLALQEDIRLVRKKSGRLCGKKEGTNEALDVVVQPEEIRAIPKPPIGVMPRDVWEEKCRQQRITDIQDAMNRFVEAKKDIPYPWVVELEQLNNTSRIFEGHTEANRQSYL